MENNILHDDSMKFEVIRMHNDGESLQSIANNMGTSRKTISRFLNRESYKDFWELNQKPIAKGDYYDHHHTIKRAKGKRFILTSAQNNTFVHSKFLRSLEHMSEHKDAQIIVGTFSYNTSGFQNLEKGDGEWFDNKIKQYILDEPLQLADDLIWCGELNVLPTAVNPLSGFHSYTKASSGIIPHVKVQMESLPVHASQHGRFLYTTGAVTQRNYIQKKAGQKASFHHIFGALIVEVDSDGDWFVRQLIADTDTGCFYDLDVYYTPDGVQYNHTVEAINWGDIHAEKFDRTVFDVSFGMGVNKQSSMIDTLQPKYQFLHDVLDFEARNHHTINDAYERFKLHVNFKDSVKQNIRAVSNVIEYMSRPFCTTVIVESNHDLAFKRWLKTADYKTDPVNALFFLECQFESYKAMANGDEFSPFEYALKSVNPEIDVKCLSTDESFMICGDEGIECGCHGHLGINGARGSINAYQRLGTRYNIGHSHSAGIKDGVYQAGVSGRMEMGYNVGPSSWSHSHIVTYKNSKRTIVTLKNGKWRA